MNTATALGFQVTRMVVRAVYHSGLFIDVTEVNYEPTPKVLGNKKRYRINYSLSENDNGVFLEEHFSNDTDAIHYTFSDDIVERAKKELNKK